MLTRASALTVCLALAACGPSEQAEDVSAPEPAPEPAATAPDTQGGGLTPTPAPPDAEVYFIEPSDGETVTNPVRVVFGLANMGVAPAGVNQSSAGHHHLLVDTQVPPPGQPIGRELGGDRDRGHARAGHAHAAAAVRRSPARAARSAHRVGADYDNRRRIGLGPKRPRPCIRNSSG